MNDTFLITCPLVIRPGVVGSIMLPNDLTAMEAGRIAGMVNAWVGDWADPPPPHVGVAWWHTDRQVARVRKMAGSAAAEGRET